MTLATAHVPSCSEIESSPSETAALSEMGFLAFALAARREQSGNPAHECKPDTSLHGSTAAHDIQLQCFDCLGGAQIRFACPVLTVKCAAFSL